MISYIFKVGKVLQPEHMLQSIKRSSDVKTLVNQIQESPNKKTENMQSMVLNLTLIEQVGLVTEDFSVLCIQPFLTGSQ